MFKNEMERHKKKGKEESESGTEDYGLEESSDSLHGLGHEGNQPDENRVITLINFGYPEEYTRWCLMENEDNYCTATYYLMGED